MRSIHIVALVLLAACGTAASSSANPRFIVQPEAGHPRCVKRGGDTTGFGYFEFQVERPAEARAVPAAPARPGPETAVVQFIVDTAGLVEPSTVKVVDPAMPVSPQLKAAVATWRFTPAEVYGCRVRQVVQIPVWRSVL